MDDFTHNPVDIEITLSNLILDSFLPCSKSEVQEPIDTQRIFKNLQAIFPAAYQPEHIYSLMIRLGFQTYIDDSNKFYWAMNRKSS